MPIFDRNSVKGKYKVIEKSFLRDVKGNPLSLEQCIFLDCETVSRYKTWKDFETNEPDMAQSFIKNKCFNWLEFRDNELKNIRNLQESGEQPVPYDTCTEDHEYLYHLRSGLFPEYNKIVTISIQYVSKGKTKTISFASHNEKELLEDFCIALSGIVQSIAKTKRQPYIVGHNVLLFDIPVIYKRMIVNDIYPPAIIHADQTKPWEKFVSDTRNIWKAGDKNGDASLNTVCYALNIKSSKDGNHGMEGSQVGVEYWQNDNLEGIVQYCEEDVDVLRQIFEKYSTLKCYTFGV